MSGTGSTDHLCTGYVGDRRTLAELQHDLSTTQEEPDRGRRRKTLRDDTHQRENTGKEDPGIHHRPEQEGAGVEENQAGLGTPQNTDPAEEEEWAQEQEDEESSTQTRRRPEEDEVLHLLLVKRT